MKILYIHQYFLTPSDPGGTRSYWLSKELLDKGHTVTMITSSKKYSEEIKRVDIDGIDVIYIKEEYDQNMGIAKRLKAFLSFMSKATKVARKEDGIDLVFATSTPLTVGIPALIMKWTKGKQFVFEVRDLWPEVPIQMGALNNSIARWAAVLLEKTIYRNASHVIALSPGMAEGVRKYLPDNKVSVIPNMAKKDQFWPRAKNSEIIRNLNLREDTFKVVHFGSLGLANGAETIIESAKLLKDDSSVEFLFVGGGSTEQELKATCTNYGLSNVKFLGKFSMTDTSEIVNFSDVSIVSFKDLPILYTNSPNKFFDSLSAGKPIIVNSAGWTKDIVKEYRCGFYVNPNKPQELVDVIKMFQSDPALVKQIGENSRSLAKNKYDKSLLTKEFVRIIEDVYATIKK